MPSAPNSPTAFAQALASLQGGDPATAQARLQVLLESQPDHGHGWHLLGIAQAQQGRYDAAVADFQRALALRPQDASVHHNLGNALALLGRHQEALEALDRSLELQPENADAQITRARMQMELQLPLAALRSLEAAGALRPDSIEAQQYRGDVLAMLCEMGMSRREDAAQAYRQALALGGDPEGIAYCLASIGEAPPPRVSPRRFVVDLFDKYADRFDQHLVQTLQYRTPQMIGQALQQVGLRGPAEMLDLGCGTGLCGPLLRPYAGRLTGVDLSAGMLAKAQETGLYDALVCDDIEAHLRGLAAALDLVVAADVFVYVGDLDTVFAATRRALRPGGLFVFSVEQHEGSDYVLRPTRRYAHAADYIARLAAAHGYAQALQLAGVLRQNSGVDVPGTVWVLRSPGN